LPLTVFEMTQRRAVRSEWKWDMESTGNRPPHTEPVPCSVWFGPVVSASQEREFIDMLVSEHGVGVCCWPRDAARVEHLARAGVPRLLLVRPDAVPPAPREHQACVWRTAGDDEIHNALVALCECEGECDCESPETRRSA
jgi:hypothetical protein